VLAVTQLESEGGWSVVLDSTCFHPQGGGQPADTGTITDAAGSEQVRQMTVRESKP